MTHIKVYGTNIEFTMKGNPTYPEMIRYAIQNNIPIKQQPIFTTTRQPDLTNENIDDLMFIIKQWQKTNNLKEGNDIYESIDKEFINEWIDDKDKKYRYSRTYNRLKGEVEWYKKTNNLLKILTKFTEKNNVEKKDDN